MELTCESCYRELEKGIKPKETFRIRSTEVFNIKRFRKQWVLGQKKEVVYFSISRDSN